MVCPAALAATAVQYRRRNGRRLNRLYFHITTIMLLDYTSEDAKIIQMYHAWPGAAVQDDSRGGWT